MSLIVSGILAIVLLVCHRFLSSVRGTSDVQTGMASALFWLVFAGAAWLNSNNGDLTNIYFYFSFAGIIMVIVMAISSLNIKPTKEVQQEKQTGMIVQSERGIAGMRQRMGWRALKRRN